MRDTWRRDDGPFLGSAEADETYMGAKRKTLTGRSTTGKPVVVGVKDGRTNKVSAARS